MIDPLLPHLVYKKHRKKGTISLSTIQPLVPCRTADSHKGDYGHACLVAGSMGMAGASILAAQACLRSGVGLLTLCVPECNRAILQCAVPEAMTNICGQEHLDRLPAVPTRCTALAIGPGLGRHTETEQTLLDLLRPESSLPAAVLDADALTLLSAHPDVLEAADTETLLTPHAGEFARLLQPFEIEADAHQREEQAAWLARRLGVHLILKGPGTVVAAPDGRVAVNTTGNAGMATGGSGDVLTGILLALRAQHLSAWDAARLGVWIHGLAGDLAAEALGQIAMTSSDLIRYLPTAWQTLELPDK